MKNLKLIAVAALASAMLGGCATVEMNVQMLKYRSDLAGKIGKWKTEDAIAKYGQPTEKSSEGEGRYEVQTWEYAIKAEGKRGYDDLTLIFDGDDYLTSWDVQISR